ncbi:MAG: nucleotidyltransferase domain-containing protein [Bdellovibrionales bacterium]|nr:nucleotidyltransferase domain-containing protein [Bdellovibrionales bacterium]
MENNDDPIINSICHELKSKYGCHTIVPYGSRARGLITPTSDYDVIGIRKKGAKTRIAKKQRGFFWDVFIYSENERCRKKDIQGLYRRSELLHALVDHYFFIRQKRFLGPKEGFAWIKKNDPSTFKLIHRALSFPANISLLKKAASEVYKVKLS